MDIYKLKTLSTDDRMTVLSAESVGVEEQPYMRPLSQEELALYKDELAQNSILQAMILDELSQVKEEFKLRLDPLKEKIGEALQALKHKAVKSAGKLYKMADYENKMIFYVDTDGNVISARGMRPEERQFHLTPKTNLAI